VRQPICHTANGLVTACHEPWDLLLHGI
jgi:hypothetical protein